MSHAQSGGLRSGRDQRPTIVGRSRGPGPGGSAWPETETCSRNGAQRRYDRATGATHDRHAGHGAPAGRRTEWASRSSSSTASSSGSPATPATACSSPVTGSRRSRRPSATTCRRCRTSRPRSGRRRARCPGVSSFQVHFADHDILTPGDAPDVLVAMNPAALRANLGDLARGATVIVDTHDFTRPQPDQGRLRREPARGRLARRVRRAPGRPDRHDRRGGQGVRALAQGRRARQEHVRARPALVAVRPPDGQHHRLPRAAFRPAARHPRRQRDGVQDGLELRRDDRVVRGLLRGQAGAACHRAPTATSPATSRCPTGSSPRACSRGCRSSSAPTRSRRPPTSSTS